MRTLHDVYVATCARKRGYEDEGIARAMAERLTHRSMLREVLTAYRCPFAPLGEGGHFHVGHVRGTKPSPAMLHAMREWIRPQVTDLGAPGGQPPAI